jgi:RND superfamily putative drug exporter
MAGTIDDAVKNAGSCTRSSWRRRQGFPIGADRRRQHHGDVHDTARTCSAADPRVPAALIVLLVVFGAVLAACMPVLMSIISIALALALTALIGQVYPTTAFALNILTMMGLAVGIDYTLFVISRYREERARGLAKIDAIAATGATANRAIFFSGMTVVLAMTGMVIIPLTSHQPGHRRDAGRHHHAAHGADRFPALLSLLGDRVDACSPRRPAPPAV